MTTYNFAAGPAVLPKTVLEQVQKEMLNFKNSNMSILEISHRSDLFTTVYQSAKQRLLALMALSPVDYDVLFLQGGATLQFTMLPLNLATKYHRVAYLDSGHWSARAIEEAAKLKDLTVDVLTSSEDNHYTNIPEFPEVLEDTYDYLHITTNNTIEGTAYWSLPETKTPLVADMSSNFLGQTYPYEAFDVIYAGAQKNLAPAGLTIVVIKKALLQQTADNLPSMLDYTALAKKDSALNTPPVFQIYVADLVLQWLEQQGGVAAMTAINQQKAACLYDFLDQSKLFHTPVQKTARSLMNIPFLTDDPAVDQDVITKASAAGLLNLKGHRLVGGLRASLYNAMSLEGVQALVTFLKAYEQRQ
ncbi:3-phosphoserine/phosphohydroxythreonine transaminase [Agrilactobacillus yilanensis]|uniref:Phosphoserine aminotransferase n=1 Tax=Agrilactobacillus yilanensis TaxID=2485997 RepID=A0ABW4J784_9LACO|nr:3-phosphoserine/phosphohydroxythreonine transaminase [Agrilactobacillus yilanensis]